MGLFSWGAVLQEQTIPVWVPHECHRSGQEPAPAWALPWSCRFLQGTSTYSGMGPSMGCRVDLCSTMGCRGTSCLTSLHHGLQGNLCSRTWSTSYPSFSTDLVVCRVVALIYSLLSPSCCCAAVFPPS